LNPAEISSVTNSRDRLLTFATPKLLDLQSMA